LRGLGSAARGRDSVVGCDHRQVLSAILWKPDPWTTAHERLRLWAADGIWQRMLDEVIVKDTRLG
jgi:hypothetical protein